MVVTGKFVLGLEGYCSIDWRVLKFHQQRCCANSRNFAQFVPNILKWSVFFGANGDNDGGGDDGDCYGDADYDDDISRNFAQFVLNILG